jgi:hypothetical protein
MEAGYQAIMDKAALLQLLSLSEADYAAHLAQRQQKKPDLYQVIKPSFIEFTGHQRTPNIRFRKTSESSIR